MLRPRFVPLVLKQIYRQRTRSALTVGGVATAMFLFCTIQSMQTGLREATQAAAGDATLVVYRENRYCPATSRLPERYRERIARIPGVTSVVPMKVVVNNCGASLDVITYRGVPPEQMAGVFAATTGFRMLEGSLEEWNRRGDGALVGQVLARRRGFQVGQRFDSSGITVTVSGIFASDEPQDQNVAYVHLSFLQRAPGINQPGIVTQFNVKVEDPARIVEVSEEIDAAFRQDEQPTQTRSEKAFVAHAAGDLMELIGFTRWVALGCMAAVLALVANTLVLSVRGRVREHAVLQTLGFSGGLIARLIVCEGLLLSLLGGAAGGGAALALLAWGQFSLSNEGLSIQFGAGPQVWLTGLGVAVLLGVMASLAPAWQASRSPIAASFRAV